MSDKVKFYKNKNRTEQEPRKVYTPQYQLMGVEPEEYKSAIAPGPQPPLQNSADNPRGRKPSIRQAYAESVSSPIGRGRGPVPNVGNNMEHTWSGVDGEVVDDIIVDENHPMVDNNEFVSAAALGIPVESHEVLDEATHPHQKKFTSQSASIDADDLVPVLHNLVEGDYLLLVNGVTVCSGSALDIQEQARLFVFGEHEMCAGNPVSVDGIVVVKRVPIKVGLFLE